MRTRYAETVPPPRNTVIVAALLIALSMNLCFCQTSAQIQQASLSGTVLDGDGANVPKAQITLIVGSSEMHTVSDALGRFTFLTLPAGPFTLTISASGLAPLATSGIIHPGTAEQLPELALLLPSASSSVQVYASQEEVAEAEMQVEEHQRLFGVLPNFFVVYDWHAPALNTRQKYQLGWKTVLDPVNLVLNAGFAGVQQAANEYSGYGQGASGYFKRFGAANADFAVGTMLGGSVLPALFHQDPRYFYKGTGTIRSRTLYALSTAVIARGDNGKWQPAYASLLGDLGAGAISNIYYPASNRQGASLTFENGLLSIASDGVNNVVQEFLLRHLTRKPPTYIPAP